jgi:hypothetical protein
LTAAAAWGEDLPITLAENGWVSLNPPLTLNRLGSLSTRTTHPYFLGQLISLWREAGINQPLLNPYRNLTKGQVLSQCRNRGLLERLFPRTVSCARPVASRWRGQGGGACGYCYPCLLRRAAAHQLGWDRGGDYLLDVLASRETLCHRVRGRDLRALAVALGTWQESPEEVADRLWLGGTGAEATKTYSLARPLLAAGFEELGQFFRDKAPEWFRSYLCQP